MSETVRRPALQLLPPCEGTLPYVWLVYAAWTFVYPAELRSMSALVATVAALAVFLPLYFWGYWTKGRGTLAILIAIATIGACAGPANPIASTYFVYAASFAPFVGTTRTAWWIVTALVIAMLIEAAALHLTIWFWLPGIVFTVLVGLITIRAKEIAAVNAELRTARGEVERLAQVTERERIARDLHDVLGHTLSVIVLKSELASRISESDLARAVLEIRDVERIARESLGEVREALAGYRAPGVAAELGRARDVLRAAGVRFECDAEDVRIEGQAESALALAIREAVTNVVRHANASTCRLQLSRGPSACRLTISDDGTGDSHEEGLGLRGMRERIELLGGSVNRETGGGTRLVLSVPLP